jgi:FkbM family methyltransferase
MVFFDVGANFGLFSLLAAARVGPEGQVHAFEPAPSAFQHLRLNARINSAANVQLNNCAVADAVGSRRLYLSTGWNQGTHSFWQQEQHGADCSVDCVTIDEYVARHHVPRLDVLKIDVEGADLLVLRGALETIGSLAPPLLIVEAVEEYALGMGYSTSDVKRFLIDRGYAVYRLHADSPPIQVEPRRKEQHANLAALHLQSKDSFRTALWDWRTSASAILSRV